MSVGINVIERAVNTADDPSNNGNGYTLRVTLKSGVQFHGSFADFDRATNLVRIELWDLNGPTRDDVFLDANEIAAAEIVW